MNTKKDKKKVKQREASKQIHALENIEGIEGGFSRTQVFLTNTFVIRSNAKEFLLQDQRTRSHPI